MQRRHAGFTIFEMVIVLVMLGILTAGLAPLLRTQHTQTMEDANKKGLNTAKDVLIAYALANGGFPTPLTAAEALGSAGPIVTPSKVEYEPTYVNPSPINSSDKWYLPWDEHTVPHGIPPLGIPTFGSYRKFFWYDPRDEFKHTYAINTVTEFNALTSKYLPLEEVSMFGGTLPGSIDPRLSLCANVRTAMKDTSATKYPRICSVPNNGQMTDSCPGGAATTSPAALVVASFGNDRTPDKAHIAINNLAAMGAIVRNYEHPARPVNHEHSAAPDIHYDDAVVSVSLGELASRCDQTGVACSADKRYLTFKNTTFAPITLYYGTPASCVAVPIAVSSRVSLGCLDSGTALWTNAGCTAPFTSATLSAADTNGDGVASIWWDFTGNATW